MTFSCFTDRDIIALDNVPEDTQALVLKGNKLSIDLLAAHNLSNVLYIDLTDNQLKLHQVEALQAFFTQLQALRALDLSNNYLETLQTNLFKDLKSLEFLSLSGNSIVYIERNIFQSLTNLKTLKLDKNHLRDIDEAWFNNASLSLRDLDLRSNRLESIQGGDMMWLRGLERLKLSKNKLSYIHTAAFVNLDIRELYLDDNLLTEIPNQAILQLKSLAILNLDHNPLFRLDENSLSDHLMLKHVSLSNMKALSVVHKSAFINLPQLVKVDLFQNEKLEYVHPQSFVNCTNIQVLHLHGCSLQGLDSSITNSLPSLNELSLYQNRIYCSCQAQWLRNTSIYLLDGNKIVCAGPHPFKMATLFALTDKQLGQDCAPLVILQSKTSITADFGTDVELECQALGSSTIHWVRPTSSISESNDTDVDSKLQIHTIQHKDEGVYTCIATTPSGESDSASVYVRVIHSVIMLRTVAVSKSFMVLQWEDTHGPTVLSYANGTESSIEVNMPSNIHEYTLENLKPDASYVVCLLYHHRLEHSCITVHMLPISRKDTVKEDNSETGKSGIGTKAGAQKVLIIFAVLVASIILVVVCIVTVKKCQRRKESKIAYLLHKDRFSSVDGNGHITLEQCYNPTTAPLCENEFT